MLMLRAMAAMGGRRYCQASGLLSNDRRFAGMRRALYSSEVQQPKRSTAIMSEQLHARQAAPFDREQGSAGSLHPDGLPRAARR